MDTEAAESILEAVCADIGRDKDELE